MAKRASGFGMRVIYADTKDVDGGERVELDYLLKESDFVSVHVPLTPDTKHLISKKELELMKPTACLINSARGPIVDEKALIEALKNKQIFGAGLDVFENEPEVPDELKQLDNAVIVPHIGSASYETRAKMSEIAAKNILLASEGKMPISLVNKEVLGKSKLKIT